MRRTASTPKSFLVSKNSSLDIRYQDEPATTVLAEKPLDARAWLSQGRVVAMTARAIARFQTFPDTYQLPDRKSLACKVIGNAVPPLFAQKLLETASV
jgi:DNA (cytosine-5)-methyltransferase 1